MHELAAITTPCYDIKVFGYCCCGISSGSKFSGPPIPVGRRSANRLVYQVRGRSGGQWSRKEIESPSLNSLPKKTQCVALSHGSATVPLTFLVPMYRSDSLELSVDDEEIVSLVASFWGKVKLRRVSLMEIFHVTGRRCQEVLWERRRER